MNRRLVTRGYGALALSLSLSIGAGCAVDPGTDGSDDADEASNVVTTGMSISGTVLKKDGVAFMPRGFNMIGALTPAWCSQGNGVQAREHFGNTELTREVDTWHANTIRLQVSQRGLEDPTLSATEINTYLQEIKTDVETARALGLVVILSMQDQGIGCGAVHPLPSAQTVAAWKKLAPAFSSSPYVMFELFNEPENEYTDADWEQWRNGGTTPLANEGDKAVGFQTLVNDIRATGAKNVLIADGAHFAEHLDNITGYLLDDKDGGHGIAYAIHPYYYAPGPTYWQKTFGVLEGSRVVIATEWNFQPSDCGTAVATSAPQFLAWLHTKGIGITAHAFDYLQTLVADWNWTPTQCGTAHPGAGEVLKAWYAKLAMPVAE